MKNVLMEINEKIMLRKRFVIETVKNDLKNMCQIEHSRHRFNQKSGNFMNCGFFDLRFEEKVHLVKTG